MEHIGRLGRTFSDLIAQRRFKANQAAAALKLEHGIYVEALTENGHKEQILVAEGEGGR